MKDDLKKLFDPKTLPPKRVIRIPVTKYEELRTLIRVAFSFPTEPERFLEWDDPHARRFLFEFQSHGGKEVIVDEQLYYERLKQLEL